jgi:integrase/recombinase XerD
MAQAKTLTKTELKRVVDVTNSCSRYAARDVTMLLLTHLCGLRIGEVASLRIADVRDTDGTIRTEIRLDAERTKNNHARTIFVPKQMQRQLREYVNSLNKQPLHGYLFSTQKQAHFSANTATQHLQRLYARAGIAGATSHSGRRTWLTALSQRGVSVFVLADMAGHRSIQTTQRYVTVNDEMKRNAAELI